MGTYIIRNILAFQLANILVTFSPSEYNNYFNIAKIIII